MVGETELQKLVSIHFLRKDLGNYLWKERPGMLFFVFNTEAIGVLVAHDLRQGEFVLQVPYYPPQQTLQDFKLEVMLVGDAAHRFPPVGGFGMNTGIQDAHNLAWKLASVVNGIAPSTFLTTYETERKPIATYNTHLGIENFNAAMAVPAALGLDPTVANTVHRVISDGLGSILPSRVQRLLLDGAFSLGRSQLADAILNENNLLGSTRLARLKHIFEEGKSLQLQFPAEDLGFRYLEGAIAHGSNKTHVPPEAPTGRRRAYIPSVEPGSRLPHMTMRFLSDSNPREPVSTLDLISGDKVEFLLIIAPIKESYDLARSAVEVAKKFGVLLKVCVVWPHIDNRANGMRSASLPCCIDIMEDKRLPTCPSWWDICKMSNRGAILVRPDEHVAWCSKSHIPGDHYIEMEKVLSTVLGFY